MNGKSIEHTITRLSFQYLKKKIPGARWFRRMDYWKASQTKRETNTNTKKDKRKRREREKREKK